MRQSLTLIAAVAVIPLAFLALRALFGWRYRRMLETIARSTEAVRVASAGPGDESGSAPLRPLSIVEISHEHPLSTSAAGLLDEARSAARAGQIAFVAATIAYAGTTMATIATFFSARQPIDGKVVGLWLIQAPVLFVLMSALSPSRRTVLRVWAIYAAAGLALSFAFSTPRRVMALISLESELFLLLPLIGVVFLCSRRLRPVLVALAAIAVYIVSGIALAAVVPEKAVDLRAIRPIFWLVGSINLAFGLVVCGWLVGRDRVRGPVVGLTIAAAAGLWIEWKWRPDIPVGAFLAGGPINVLQMFLVWMAFRAAVWLQRLQLLPQRALQSHLALGLVTIYFATLLLVGTALFRQSLWSIAGLEAAFVLHVAILHLLLYRAWRSRRTRKGKRLLFLRVFGSRQRSERLLNALDNSWRYVGPIDLIAGVDLAVQTMDSTMLQAFLARKPEKLIVRTGVDVERAIGRRRSSLEGDVRYPVNEFICTASVWQLAFSRLATDADIVLMDMRGFTRQHLGCIFELTELIARIPLHRLVVVADDTTDRAALHDVAHGAWEHLAVTSPNVGGSEPTMRVQAFTRFGDREARRLFESLLDAAA